MGDLAGCIYLFILFNSSYTKLWKIFCLVVISEPVLQIFSLFCKQNRSIGFESLERSFFKAFFEKAAASEN